MRGRRSSSSWWPGAIDLRAVSECYEHETLDLYSCFPDGGRDCRGFVLTLASALVDEALADLGPGVPAAGGRDPARAMWLGWLSLRARIDTIATARAIRLSKDLLWASRLGCHVRVGFASVDEIDALDTAAGDDARETLTSWTLVAVRDPTAATTVHALGRLDRTGAPWLSLPLVAVDRSTGFVRTQWGDVYRLSGPREEGLCPALHALFKQFLELAGYANVRG